MRAHLPELRRTLQVVGIALCSACPATPPSIDGSPAFGSGPGAARSVGGYVTIDSSRVYYEECGTAKPGPTIVLLHDGLLHSVTWDDVWPLMCATHHTLRYDRRGMGRSDPPKQPFIPTEDLTALLAARGISSVTLVGSSSGSGLAIDYAFRHPDKVDRLVLIGPVVHGMPSSAHFLARGAANNAPLAKGDVEAAARNWANDRYQIASGHTAAREKLFRALTANPRDLTYQGNLELRFAVPAAARMSEIRAPTLILVGAEDIPDVQAYAGAVELGIWGAKRDVVEGVGHLIQLEAPDVLAKRVDDFIAQTPIVTVDTQRLRTFAGRYDSLMYGRAGEFLVNSGRLVVRVPTERDLPLFPSSDSTFYALAWGGIRFAFHHDSTAHVTSVDVSDAQGTHHATRAVALGQP